MALKDRFIGVNPMIPIGLSFRYEQGSLLPRNRQKLVEYARTVDDPGPVTHLLFLDDDMMFPAELMYRLFEHDKPIVAVNYPTRKAPIHMTAQKGGKPLSSADKIGTEAVDFAGMGAMLVQLAVFDKLETPYFSTAYWKNERGEGYISEDAYFCLKARKAGFDILVDHGLSQEVSHIGSAAYSHIDAEAERVMAEAAE
jgi:hypothetical protein